MVNLRLSLAVLAAAVVQANDYRSTWSSWSSWSTSPQGRRTSRNRQTHHTYGNNSPAQARSSRQQTDELPANTRVQCRTSCTNGNCKTRCTKNGIEVSEQEANFSLNIVRKPASSPGRVSHTRNRSKYTRKYSSCNIVCTGGTCKKNCSNDSQNPIVVNVRKNNAPSANIHMDFRVSHKQQHQNSLAGCSYPRIVVGNSCRLPSKRPERKDMCTKISTHGTRKHVKITGLVSKGECCCDGGQKWGSRQCFRPDSAAASNICAAVKQQQPEQQSSCGDDSCGGGCGAEPENQDGGCPAEPEPEPIVESGCAAEPESSCGGGCDDSSSCGGCDNGCGEPEQQQEPECNSCGGGCPEESNSCGGGCEQESSCGGGCEEESSCGGGCEDNSCDSEPVTEPVTEPITEPATTPGYTEAPTTEDDYPEPLDDEKSMVDYDSFFAVTEEEDEKPTCKTCPTCPELECDLTAVYDDSIPDNSCSGDDCGVPKPVSANCEPDCDGGNSPDTPGSENAGSYIDIMKEYGCETEDDCVLPFDQPPATDATLVDTAFPEVVTDSFNTEQRVTTEAPPQSTARITNPATTDTTTNSWRGDSGGNQPVTQNFPPTKQPYEVTETAPLAPKQVNTNTQYPVKIISYEDQTELVGMDTGPKFALHQQAPEQVYYMTEANSRNDAPIEEDLSTPPVTQEMVQHSVGVCSQGNEKGNYIFEHMLQEECCCAAYIGITKAQPRLANRQFRGQACPLPKTREFRTMCPAKHGVAVVMNTEGKREPYDIDECTLFHACGPHGDCENFKRSYSCDCQYGFVFDPISMKCSPPLKQCYVGLINEISGGRHSSPFGSRGGAPANELPGFNSVSGRNMNMCGEALGQLSQQGCCCDQHNDLLSTDHGLPGAADPSRGGNGKYSWGKNCQACPEPGTSEYNGLCDVQYTGHPY